MNILILTKNRLVIAMFLVLLFSVYYDVFAGDCDEILEQGVRNTYQELRTQNLNTGFHDALCQNIGSVIGQGSSGSVGFKLPIFKVPVQFGGSYQQTSSEVQNSGACRENSSSINDKTYVNILKQVVSSEIVDAWSKCQSNQGGFYINGSLNGNILVLEFRFRPTGNVTSTRLTEDPDINGAKCEKLTVVKGTVISNSKLLQICSRTGSGEITVIANSEFDGAMFFIPAVRQVEPERVSDPVRPPGAYPAPPPGAYPAPQVH